MLNPIDTSRWTHQDIIKEAQMQSAAIARLDTWKRLAFSLTAVGAILVIWGHGSSIMPGMVAGIICLVLGIPASAVLTVGVNHAKVNSTGVEADVKLDLRRLVPGQRVLRSFSVAYAYIDQDQRREEGVLSLYALEYLRHKVVAKLGLNILPNLNFDASYRYQERVGSYADTEGVSRSYKPYSLVDARLSWDKLRYGVYLEVNNLLDASYVDYGNVPQPGLWIMAGAMLNFMF